MTDRRRNQQRREVALRGSRLAAARRWARRVVLSAGLLTSGLGCRSYNNYAETIGNDTTWVDRVVAEVDAGAPPPPAPDPMIQPVTLRTVEDRETIEYWDISLDEVISIAMANSQVLRDLGGTILSSPQSIATQYSRPLAETDPRFGMEAALSAFDAQFNALAGTQHNHRIYNNRFLGGGANNFRQDTQNYIAELNKIGATGARYALRHITDYDNNNAPGNLFGSAWQTQVEGEIRQPLLQGGGMTFNRIAGPGATPGVSNGILIAKVNTDINSAQFNVQLRNYLSDVINAYWDLYFSYRDLDAKQVALDRARDTWQAYEAEKAADRKGGVAEALSREQFFRFQSELENAIAGKVTQRTQARNGATGGSFRGVNGVQAAERRLRLLIGLPVNEPRIIRPSDDPELAPVVFDWESMAAEAVFHRPELQSQSLLVKRRELELIAARNFLQPQLDAYGTYRLRGLGHDLMGDQMRDGLRSAYSELGEAGFREWEVGLQFNMPIGFRQGHAAVQNAELQLARDRAILREQQRQVLHDLSDMVGEVDRAWKQCQTNLNRYLAAKDAVDALEANREVGLPVNLEQVLDAQRRLTEAQSQYYLARSEYAVAIKNVHLEKGSLFEYSNVLLVDNTATPASSPEAAAERALLARPGANSQSSATGPSTASTSPPSSTADPATPATASLERFGSSPGEEGRTRVSLNDPETLTAGPLGADDGPISSRVVPAAVPATPVNPIGPTVVPASAPHSLRLSDRTSASSTPEAAPAFPATTGASTAPAVAPAFPMGQNSTAAPATAPAFPAPVIHPAGATRAMATPADAPLPHLAAPAAAQPGSAASSPTRELPLAPIALPTTPAGSGSPPPADRPKTVQELLRSAESSQRPAAASPAGRPLAPQAVDSGRTARPVRQVGYSPEIQLFDGPSGSSLLSN